MAGIAGALAELGLAVARFDFPYMHAGRKAPDPAPALIETWRLARAAVAERVPLPLVAGGKSLGGRIASMAVAEGMPAEALVFLGYPLHPPGRPEKLRREHLEQVAVPMLFLQGSRDAFAQPDLLAETIGQLRPRARLVEVDGGDHSFRVPGGARDGAAIGAGLAPAVAGFVAEVTRRRRRDERPGLPPRPRRPALPGREPRRRARGRLLPRDHRAKRRARPRRRLRAGPAPVPVPAGRARRGRLRHLARHDRPLPAPGGGRRRHAVAPPPVQCRARPARAATGRSSRAGRSA